MFKVKYIHQEEDNILIIKFSDFDTNIIQNKFQQKGGTIQYKNENNDTFSLRMNSIVYISIPETYGNSQIIDIYFPRSTKFVSYAIDLCTRYTKDYYIDNFNKLFVKFME